jgi:hypothetical protein
MRGHRPLQRSEALSNSHQLLKHKCRLDRRHLCEISSSLFPVLLSVGNDAVNRLKSVAHGLPKK